MAKRATETPPVRRGGRARKLDHDTIAQAAFDLVDAEGVGALTIARLATELNVGTMTLYGYADSKDEIVGMMPAVLLADLPKVPAGMSWEDALERTFLAVYNRLAKHANVTQAVVQVPVFDLAQARLFESVLEVLTEAGFDLEDAFILHRALSSFTVGYALFQIAELQEGAPRRSRLELHPDDFPLAAKTARFVSRRAMKQHYVRSIRGIIAGFSPKA